MQLGPIQKAWIKSLRENGHRQIKCKLGNKTEGESDYKACCLGEGAIIAGVGK